MALGRGSGSAGLVLAALTLGLAGLRQLALTADRQRLRRRLEERVARRTAELRQLTEEYQRLEAMKHGFVSSVSHELRTPLTAIHGSLELLADGDTGVLPPTALDVVGVALRGTRRLGRLVEDIIEVERLQHGSFTLCTRVQPLAPLIGDAVDTLSGPAAEGRVRLVLGHVGECVVADGDRVVQVVVNLVGNAVKFTPAGGTVAVTTSSNADEVVVTVTDEGVGIPSDQLESVFERFHQVESGDRRGHGGAGLGLAITRHLVEAHGGRVWVESTVGVGSTFRFTLPRAPRTAATRRGRADPSSGVAATLRG